MSEGVSPKASRYAAAKRLMCRIPRPTATATDRGGIAAGSLEGLAETVDHHLRTPLTVILGHVELMTDSEQELPAEVHQSLACVLSAGRQLNEVVVGICELFDVACGSERCRDRRRLEAGQEGDRHVSAACCATGSSGGD